MEWKPTWRQEEINYDGISEVHDHTQRVSVLNNLKAEKIRIRFSNRWSETKLVFDDVTVGIQKEKKCPLEHIVQVTVGGEKQIIIEPGEEMVSDEISLSVHVGDWIAVSTYVNEPQNPCGAIGFWNPALLYVKDAEGCYTKQSDFVSELQEKYFADFYAKLPETPQIVYGVSGIDVYAETDTKVIAAFGDSITHIGNWTSPFTKALYEKYPGKVSVINCGIAGNCLSNDHPTGKMLPCGGKLFGDAGVRRFDHSVYRDGKIDVVILLIGSNDLLYPFVLPVEAVEVDVPQLIADHSKIIDIAKAHGSKVAHGLIPPFQTDENKCFIQPVIRRNKINQWILTDSKADFKIPFCDAVCDETKERLRSECDSGDGLHPSILGGQLMAEAAIRCFEEEDVFI